MPNLVRSKLVRLMSKEHPETLYATDIDEVKRWIKVINKEVFDGKLKPFRSVKVLRLRATWAYAEGSVDEDGEYQCDLVVNHSMVSRKQLVEVLCHESVHAYQWTRLHRMDHKRSFFRWKPKLAKFGIRLSIGIKGLTTKTT